MSDINVLLGLKVSEVSLVDEPASKDARVALYKRDGSRQMSILRQGLERLFGPFTKNLDEVSKAEFNKGLDEFEKTLSDVEKADADALAKMSTEHQAFAKGLDDAARAEFMKADEAGRTAQVKAHAEGVAKAKADLEKVNKENDAVTITKADLDSAIAKAVTAAVEPLQKSNEELRADLAKRDAEAMEKGLFDELKAAGVAGAPEMAKTLMAVPAGATRDTLKKGMIASAEQLRKAALFGEIGGSSGAGPDSALAKLNALAAEVRKSDSKLTQEQAFAKVYSDPANTELRKAYKAERGAAN